MVTIAKAEKTLIVPDTAYETIYAPAGWTIKGSKKNASAEEETSSAEVSASEELTPEELLEKPLEDLNFEELKTVADYLGLEVEGQKSSKKLREAIKAAQGE